MSEQGEWIFPSNGHGVDSGLNIADFETFKKDSIVSLAREIVQNSIDAKTANADFVRVEFNTFIVNRSDIPDIDTIQNNLQSAYKLRKETGDNNAANAIKRQLDNVKKQKFKCLRISDFNTTGLTGVSTDKIGSKYYYLIKGSGLSNKGANSGGSKGVGKNATYVNSTFETVFYSTYTEQEEKGYIGVAKLSSARIEGTDEITAGTGFYGKTDKILAIHGLLNLDPSFKRNEYGTDIYIIDFRDDTNWEKNIIPKILESFMYALLQGKLVVKVGAYVLNSTNLSTYVLSGKFLGNTNKDRDIIAQYKLLTSGLEPYLIDVDGLGTVKFYFLDCTDSKNREFGNKKCAIIRYPYMKIKDEKFNTYPPFTGLCIIENDNLCHLLREVENPQHEDFEFGRLEKNQVAYYKNFYYNSLLGQVENYIRLMLSIDGTEEIDFVGADEYISEDAEVPEDNGSEEGKERQINAIGHFSKKKRKVKAVQQNRLAVPDSEGESVIVDIVGENDSDDEILTPDGHNNSKGGPYHTGDKYDNAKQEGDSKEGIRLAQLRGIKYRFACLDKKKGLYMIRFKSDYTLENVSVEIKSIDESYNKEAVSIISAEVNGAPVPVDSNRSFNIDLFEDRDVVINVVLDQDEYFSAEVVCRENR